MIIILLWFGSVFGLVVENLESHGIYYVDFQAWKGMEFK